MGSNRLTKTGVPNPVAALILVSAMAATGTATANQCEARYIAPDQSEPQANDDYYHMDGIAVDDKTRDQLEEFADLLDGRWMGTGIDVDCSTSNGESHSTITSYDIDAEIEQHFQGAIVLRAEKETSRKVKLETIFFSPEIEKQRQGLQKGHRSYTVTFSEPNTLVFEEKYRVYNRRPAGQLPANMRLVARAPTRCKNPTGVTQLIGTNARIFECGFQRMIHDIKTVSIENHKLTINRDLYVNGHFVAQQEWQLNKAY